MYCAHRRQPRSFRHSLSAACLRCTGRAAALSVAVFGLLALVTPVVPASAAVPAPAAGQRPFGPPVPATGPASAKAPAKASAKAPAAAHGKAPAASRAAVRAAPRAAVAPAWVAPVPGAPMSEPYGLPDAGYAAGYHTGTDFAVDQGTPVDAVAAGTVASAGWQTSYGNTVVLRLPGGWYALYAHLSAIGVSEGQSVAAGQRVGRSGDTGNSTGPHLHFEIRTSDVYGDVVDPLAYLRSHGVTDF